MLVLYGACVATTSVHEGFTSLVAFGNPHFCRLRYARLLLVFWALGGKAHHVRCGYPQTFFRCGAVILAGHSRCVAHNLSTPTHAYQSRACAHQASTKLPTFHDFISDELLLKSGFVWMTKAQVANDDDNQQRAVGSIVDYFTGLSNKICGASGGDGIVFSSLVRERVWAATQILNCAFVVGAKDDGQFRPV